MSSTTTTGESQSPTHDHHERRHSVSVLGGNDGEGGSALSLEFHRRPSVTYDEAGEPEWPSWYYTGIEAAVNRPPSPEDAGLGAFRVWIAVNEEEGEGHERASSDGGNNEARENDLVDEAVIVIRRNRVEIEWEQRERVNLLVETLLRFARGACWYMTFESE